MRKIYPSKIYCDYDNFDIKQNLFSSVQDLLPDDQELCARSSRWAQMFEVRKQKRWLFIVFNSHWNLCFVTNISKSRLGSTLVSMSNCSQLYFAGLKKLAIYITGRYSVDLTSVLPLFESINTYSLKPGKNVDLMWINEKVNQTRRLA